LDFDLDLDLERLSWDTFSGKGDLDRVRLSRCDRRLSLSLRELRS
jgi:hypothetical protein